MLEKMKLIQVFTVLLNFDIYTTIKHFSPNFLQSFLRYFGTFCNLACVSSVGNLSPTEEELEMEYYDVYDYYGEAQADVQLALLLSVFSLITGALAWLRKVQSSFFL